VSTFLFFAGIGAAVYIVAFFAVLVRIFIRNQWFRE